VQRATQPYSESWITLNKVLFEKLYFGLKKAIIRVEEL
jgi:hypothetical protein